MRNKKKIGILGGTFNPVHKGHLALAHAAGEQYHLEQVWLMVSKMPPHKEVAGQISAEQRLYMVSLAVSEKPYDQYMTASDFELKREGYIYTADTLSLLAEQYPEFEFYFIIGGDSLDYLEQWYHPEIIFSHATILASGRDDFQLQEVEKKIAQLKQIYENADIRPVRMEKIPYSSTQIRKLAAAGEEISAMTGRKVANYIRKNHIYGA